MDNAARARQRVLALFLPVTAALHIGAVALDPPGTDQQITTRGIAFKLLPIAVAHSTRLYASGSLTFLALGALAVSYAAIATLVRKRGSALATAAVLIGGIGAFCGAFIRVLVGYNLAVAARAHMAPDAAAQFLTTSFHSRAGQLFTAAYFIGVFLGPVLMGVALWRSRCVPRWLAVLFVAGLELAQHLGAIGRVPVLLLTMPSAVAMILLAALIWHAAARPAHPIPEPAVVAVAMPG
jgi:hypothetical protein